MCLNWVEHLPVGQVSLRDMRDQFVLETLRYFDGNRTYTWEALGISQRGLNIHLRRLEEKGVVIPAPTRGVAKTRLAG